MKPLRERAKATFSSGVTKNKIKLGAWNHCAPLPSQILMVPEEAKRHWIHLHLISGHWKPFRYIEELVACVSVQYWRLSKLTEARHTADVCVSAAVKLLYHFIFMDQRTKNHLDSIVTWLVVLYVQLKETTQFSESVSLCQNKKSHISTMIKCSCHHSNQSCQCAAMSSRGQVMLGWSLHHIRTPRKSSQYTTQMKHFGKAELCAQQTQRCFHRSGSLRASFDETWKSAEPGRVEAGQGRPSH